MFYYEIESYIIDIWLNKESVEDSKSMSVLLCYADKEKAIIMADSLWTDISGGNNSVESRKVFEINRFVICGVAGSSKIYKIYDNILNKFLFDIHFIDEVLRYIDSKKEELCSFIPTNEVGYMVIAGFEDKDRSDIKVVQLCFKGNGIEKCLYDKYPRIAIALPPDVDGIESEEILKSISLADGSVVVGIKNMIRKCIDQSSYCGGEIIDLQLTK